MNLLGTIPLRVVSEPPDETEPSPSGERERLAYERERAYERARERNRRRATRRAGGLLRTAVSRRCQGD